MRNSLNIFIFIFFARVKFCFAVGGSFQYGLLEKYVEDNKRQQDLFDVTKNEWDIEEDLAKPYKKKKGCSVRLVKSNTLKLGSGGRAALFSTGEVGTWDVVSPPFDISSGNVDFSRVSYEEALRKTSPILEIEIESEKRDDPSVFVYRFPIGIGNLQATSVLPQCSGTVTHYPEGRSFSYGIDDFDASEKKNAGVNVGSASIHVKLGRHFVDPSWVKGRRWFWSKRSHRGMSDPGYF